MRKNETTSAVQGYFRAKRKELMALAELPVCNHSGLIGGHREQIYRAYLGDLLPRRYSVGRGMVYDILKRSKEADIVIWDSSNFPSLPLLDHSFFFAESVRGVIECKSNWSAEEFQDVREKSAAINAIAPLKDPTLDDAVETLDARVSAIEYGVAYQGTLLVKHQIGSAAMFLGGGGSLTPEKLLKLADGERPIDQCWPHVMVFLETGLLVIKDEIDGEGCLEFFKFGDDVLLAFSIALMKLVEDRVVHSEARFLLERYAIQILEWQPIHVQKFPLTRLAVGRRHFTEPYPNESDN
ncbi:DUF6602 domain-containing protein [Janthinobacterium lividum]|uniref:DUF6602 domain-containing protein n=1 Tax=Janthinobacterium lividum TaxID=29581 RepID=A0ABU0XUR5_9BURK|nr:DUF6602 domain-containing protein [Janthinobacterium lividum]MDQ4626709.1 hypothetical protein [Janthinobacterium lividum]MDQ4674324.1 hypothetical protein [Janthinobacterium lividum]MDQ4685055.1 hypothetical protein [Janthinobacterium lividum]